MKSGIYVTVLLLNMYKLLVVIDKTLSVSENKMIIIGLLSHNSIQTHLNLNFQVKFLNNEWALKNCILLKPFTGNAFEAF